MKVAIIGCGVMGSAFARFLVKKHEVFLCGKDQEKLKALSSEIGAPVEKTELACKKAEVILLAFKPKDLAIAAKEISAFTEGKILISILTSTDSSVLKSYFPKAHIVRTMPNLAITLGEGVIGIADHINDTVKDKVASILTGMGLIYFLPESKIDAFTALCGSSPAFVLVILEAMMEGGVSFGFSFADSEKLIIKVFEGTLALLKASGKHAVELKMQISSPGGTTIAGLNEMEQQGVRSGLIKTLFACYHRAQEIGRQQNKPQGS